MGDSRPLDGSAPAGESPSTSNTNTQCPTPRTSGYSALPTPPIDLAALAGGIAGASYDPQYPFSHAAPSPPSPIDDKRIPESTKDLEDNPTPSPTWPDPSSFSFAPVSRSAAFLGHATPIKHTQTHYHRTGHPSLSASLSHALKPRSLLSSKLVRFEVALVDRLADFLVQDSTVASVLEASGVISAEVTSERGHRRWVCTGSASAVNKARQLVDARLSQTPIRIRLSLRLPPDIPHVLSFYPAPSSAHIDGEATSLPTHRLVCAPAPPAPTPPSPDPPFTPLPLPLPVRPRLRTRNSSGGSHSSFQALFANGVVGPFRHFRETSADATPTSEKSDGSYFSAMSSPHAYSPAPSPSSNASASVSSIHLLGLSESPSPLPQIGSFEAHKAEYISAVVDELEACVQRRSLVRLKVVVGQQAWLLHDEEKVASTPGESREKGWPMDEVERWKVDAPRPLGTPHFDYSMSSATMQRLVRRLERRGFARSKASSQVHLLHLDRRRAVYAVATAEVRGHDLRNLPPGQGANGTLGLKKVSTLPSKPFSLSISKPGRVILPSTPSSASEDGHGGQKSEEEEPRVELNEGTDLRVKVLADKAATSPSTELSAAFQQATWSVDDDGVFNVNVRLDPGRFSEGQTSVRWAAKERWENGTLRATVSENRHHASSSRTWELDLTSQVLNTALAEYSLEAGGAKVGRGFDRGKVTAWVSELVEFAVGLVDGEREEEEEEEEDGGEGEEDGTLRLEKSPQSVGGEDSDEMVATAGVSPIETPPANA
ncbi:hypothetical protein JCM8097_001418 [Rhodosporidiobolus ruineniae]